MAKRTKPHTEEFKRDAVRLMRNRSNRTVAQIADDLGVAECMLYRWAGKQEKESKAKRSEQGETLEQENRQLRKENEQLRIERTILKKQQPSSRRKATRHLSLYQCGEGQIRYQNAV
jgi:transposase-like protein